MCGSNGRGGPKLRADSRSSPSRRRPGCLLALDDFGAGFASFNYLKNLRFDVLKIDGEFVRGLNDNPTDRLVVEAVVAIARGLGTPSLAEFVTDSASTTRRASTSAGRCRSRRRCS